MSESDQSNIFTPPSSSIPQPIEQDSYDKFRGTGTPVVIDNGSTTFRYGFCTASEPHQGSNVVARFKERKSTKPLLLFGEGIDMDSSARAQARTPWEGDVLLNFDALEHAMDHAFIHLGVDTDSIEHPIIMTERLCSPLHSRALTSELMFELYSVPSLTYCVDSLMSLYHNNLPTPPNPYSSDGLVISFNTASTSVIPVLSGKGIMSNAKRIPWGASQASEYLLKRLQLKYPSFPSRITLNHTTWILQNLCEFATDYTEVVRELKEPLRLRACERIIQFPFVQQVENEKTEEEMAKIAERRKEQGKKLQEMAANKRMEKLLQKENDLQYLTDLKESRGKEGKKDWTNRLQSEGFDSDSALDEAIKKLEYDLKRARKKEADGDEILEEPSYPLLDTPDADLDEDGLKEKRKQKLMKAGFEARARARREKEREREEREADERREIEDRENDLTGWASKMRKEHESTIGRIKERNRRKAALTDRKSAVAQARMKSIASLAADDRVTKKRRKGGGEDMFGADDSDWLIYRKINTATASSDEEEDLNRLGTMENKLLMYDPTFKQEHTYSAINSQKSALMTAFKPKYDEGDTAGSVRIHLNTERWRICEAWFSPGMAGIDSAGLGEVIQNVLSRYSDDDKKRLVNNVFVTGSPSKIPGLIPRLNATLRPILPPEMPIHISGAADPSLDAWKGMADLGKTDELRSVGVSRAEYDEWGGERIRRWWGGNWNSSFL